MPRRESDDHSGAGGAGGGGTSTRDGVGLAASTGDPVAELDRREQAQRIDDALWQLDDVARTMVVLRYYEGLSSHAIAELLATTPAAVDMRLSRARQTLRTL